METVGRISRTGTIGSLVVFCVIFLQLNQRPAILQAMGKGMFLLSSSLLALLFFLGYRAELTARKRAFLGITWLAASYLVGQSLITAEGISFPVLVNTLFVLSAGLSVLIISRENWRTALGAFVYPTLVFALSYLVTAVLVLIIQVPLENLSWTSFYLAQAGDPTRYDITVYFPFSLAVGFGNARFLEIPLARAIGYFREPGIFQILVVISYFGVDYLDIQYRRFWKITLVVTLLLTYSTAGMGCFIAAYMYYYVFAHQPSKTTLKAWRQRIASIVLLLPVSYWFIFGEKKFALLEKLTGSSGGVRVEKTMKGLEALQAHPVLGVGYQHPDLSAITFLSAAGEIGGLGVLLFLSAWILPNIDLIRRRDRRLVFLVPVMLTTLFGQPLFDKPLYLLTTALVVAAPRVDRG
jgi:hypothetical protein